MWIMATKKKAMGKSNQAPQTELVDPKTIKPHPKRHLVPTISTDQYEVIKADVKANGFRKPSVVNQKGQIVDGHTRKQIAEELEVPFLIERRDLTPSEEMQHLVLDNLCRRHLTESQRAAMLTDPSTSEEVMAPFREAANERMKQGAAKGRVAKKKVTKGKGEAMLPQPKKKRAPQVRDQVAKLAGVSGRTVSDAKAAWEKAPERMKAVIKGESKQTVASVINEIRKAEKATEAEKAIKNGNVEFEKLFTLKIHDVWTFKDLDPGFGKAHPGNIPASLVANLIHYFTKPGDLVVDPMAGGGVTGDVCRALGRECVMADLQPDPSQQTPSSAAHPGPSPPDRYIDQNDPRVPKRIFLRLAKEDAFPSTKVGKKILAKWSDVEAALVARRRKPRSRVEPQATDGLDQIRRDMGLVPRGGR